jgi:hypothetical protein
MAAGLGRRCRPPYAAGSRINQHLLVFVCHHRLPRIACQLVVVEEEMSNQIIKSWPAMAMAT